MRVLGLLSLACALFLPHRGAAHVGPPYPMVVDEQVAGYLVSIWGDPDIGTATFHVLLDPDTRSEEKRGSPVVEVWVRPLSGRLPRRTLLAARQPGVARLQFVATPRLDRQERWQVGIVVREGSRRGEIVTAVEATPDGLGPWSVVFFTLPFLATGGLWTAAVVRRARERRLYAP